MDPSIKLQNLTPDGQTKYMHRKVIGCLQYIAGCTRLNIDFSGNYLSRYQHLANEEFFKLTKRIQTKGFYAQYFDREPATIYENYNDSPESGNDDGKYGSYSSIN